MNRSQATALVVVLATLVLQRLSRGARCWGVGREENAVGGRKQKGVQGRNDGGELKGWADIKFHLASHGDSALSFRWASDS
jgi:hypothetical protein